MPWSTGDFINIAAAAGARMGDLSTAWRSQIVLDEAVQARTLAAGVFFPPGDSMVQVNRYGVRAVDENRNYNDRTTVHGYFDATLSEFPNLLMFMIYDQRSAEAFAGAYPFPATPTGAGHVLSGNSLAELTARIEARLAEVAGHTGGFSLSPDFAANLQQTITPASMATHCREMMKNFIVESTPTTMNGTWFSHPCAATPNGRPTRAPR
jgi:hypothetical protein